MPANKQEYTQICGHFSKTADDQIVLDTSCLMYFKEPHIPTDLNVGYECGMQRFPTYSEDRINNILHYISQKKRDINKIINSSRPENPKGLIKCAQYITSRGILKLIMESSYNRRNQWTIFVSRYKGNIYISRLQDTSDFTILEFYPHKFKQCCLVDNPGSKPDTSSALDLRSQFYTVVAKKFIGRSFLFAAEMDGAISESPLKLDTLETYDDIEFIHLHQCNDLSVERNRWNFERNKSRRAWLKAYLVGIDKIMFGERTEDGILKDTVVYSLQKLESIWKVNKPRPSNSFSYLQWFLNLVETKLGDLDCPYTVWQFDKKPYSKWIRETLHEGKSEYSFLPDWYLEAV